MRFLLAWIVITAVFAALLTVLVLWRLALDAFGWPVFAVSFVAFTGLVTVLWKVGGDPETPTQRDIER